MMKSVTDHGVLSLMPDPGEMLSSVSYCYSLPGVLEVRGRWWMNSSLIAVLPTTLSTDTKREDVSNRGPRCLLWAAGPDHSPGGHLALAPGPDPAFGWDSSPGPKPHRSCWKLNGW